MVSPRRLPIPGTRMNERDTKETLNYFECDEAIHGPPEFNYSCQFAHIMDENRKETN
jgi:hypothetical protein